MVNGPEICVAGEFRIDRDGIWHHEGGPIGRKEMVKLFASVLRRDENGAYWLQTPVEKVPVWVEDAPFLAVELEAEGAGPGRRLRVRTNLDDWVTLDAAHPLVLRESETGPRPYVIVAGGLEARVTRSVYYQLAELAETGPGGVPGVRSAGCFFPLEPAAPGQRS